MLPHTSWSRLPSRCSSAVQPDGVWPIGLARRLSLKHTRPLLVARPAHLSGPYHIGWVVCTPLPPPALKGDASSPTPSLCPRPPQVPFIQGNLPSHPAPDHALSSHHALRGPTIPPVAFSLPVQESTEVSDLCYPVPSSAHLPLPRFIQQTLRRHH